MTRNCIMTLVLAIDTSSYGVGAVLSHVYPNGSERAIQYASQSLSEMQKRYSQIDKEAYAIIFGIKNSINIYMEITLHLSRITGH